MEKGKQKCGGLEFIPLPAGKSEADFKVPRGRSHPRQLSVLPELLEMVEPDGRRAK
jgi:hypothetical protein